MYILTNYTFPLPYTKAVRLMLQNLLISNIELRSEDSPDIVPYTFQRTIQKIVVPMGKELEDIKKKLLTVLEVNLEKKNIKKYYQNSKRFA